MKRLVLLIILASLMLASCARPAAEGTATPSAGEKLTPYRTATLAPTLTATPPDAPTATLAPTIKPTPGVYVVKANDTLIVIAYRNGLTLAELEAANPDVNAYNLAIGMKLNIPAGTGKQGTQTVPTPTPAPLIVQAARCVPSITGGLYCFAMVQNNQEIDQENLTAEFRLTDAATGDVITHPAQFPLNRLRAGSTLPFYAYFPQPGFANPEVALQVLTATSAGTDGGNTLPVAISDVQFVVAADGSSAAVTGSARLEGEGWSVKKMVFAAVAYDITGEVLGVRRVEVDSAMNAGEVYPCSLTVYSTGGKIAKVELFGEGLP